MPARDPQKLRAAQRRYRERHREAIRARKRAAYAEDAPRQRARQKQRRTERRDDVLAYNRKWSADYRARLRAEFIADYGSRCGCCGEAEPAFLQLDHIQNDGAAHRREHKTGAKLLASLKRAGWPKDRYRLLCANCNYGRAMNGGICPHEAHHA